MSASTDTTPVTHDYRRPTWGHAISIFGSDEGIRIDALGLGSSHFRRPVMVGDTIQFRADEEDYEYVVEKVERMGNPRDGWKAVLVHPTALQPNYESPANSKPGCTGGGG